MSQQEGPSTLTLSPHNIFPFLAPVALVCLAALPSCPMQPWRLSSHLPQYHPAKLQRRAVKGCQAPLKPQATASNEVPASGLHSCIQCSHLPAKGQSPGKSRPARMPHSLDMIPATVPVLIHTNALAAPPAICSRHDQPPNFRLGFRWGQSGYKKENGEQTLKIKVR